MFIYSCGTHFLFIQMFSFFGGSQFKNKKSDFGDGGLTFESGLGIIFFFCQFFWFTKHYSESFKAIMQVENKTSFFTSSTPLLVWMNGKRSFLSFFFYSIRFRVQWAWYHFIVCFFFLLLTTRFFVEIVEQVDWDTPVRHIKNREMKEKKEIQFFFSVKKRIRGHEWQQRICAAVMNAQKTLHSLRCAPLLPVFLW